MRRLTLVFVLVAVMVAGVLPAAADPPDSSGNVVRESIDDFAILFPDFDHGYWVFINVTRADFCGWIAGGFEGPFPALDEASFQGVSSADAFSVRIDIRDAQIFLHDLIFPDPCFGSAEDASLWGTVHTTLNDNDGPNEGKRANAFGDRSRGTLEDADGNLYHWNSHIKFVFPPDVNRDDDPDPFDFVTSAHSNLKPIGNHG